NRVWSGMFLPMNHTRFWNISSGKSKASACTSWGMQRVTVPVSAWEVSTRITSGKAVINCSGLLIRSQYLDTGLKQSFTDTSCDRLDSSCCNTGATCLVANISPGIKSTGILLIVAAAAAVSILVAPGPMDEVQTKVCNLFFTLAKAAAVCTIDRKSVVQGTSATT